MSRIKEEYLNNIPYGSPLEIFSWEANPLKVTKGVTKESTTISLTALDLSSKRSIILK